MTRTVLTTTGTSLLGNAARVLNKPNKPAKALTDNDLIHFLKTEGPATACAETNSLSKIATPADEIVLLYTNTVDGERCVKEIHRYLKSSAWSNVRLQKLLLEQNEAQFERSGLRALANILIEEINQAQRKQHEVIINATGGFKAEIAYTTMVGMVFQVPVKYIYQDFEKPITFPALPIAWNIDLMLEYDWFFDWIDAECRKQTEVDQRLNHIDESDRERIRQLLLPPDVDEEVFLSPAGEILWKRFRSQREMVVEDPLRSTIPEKERISSSLKEVKHHYPKGTLAFAEKVAALEPVEEITGGNFENTTMPRVKRADADGTIKLLWADNEKAVNLTIRTTARTQVQTMQFCEHHIRPLLES
jgi:putative CRISPR-associated protein (TIGR02619 family)